MFFYLFILEARSECKFIDAFTVAWSSLFSYIFTPFSLLGRVVQKLRRDRAESIVIAPIWPTQSWYADLLQLVIDNPIILPMRDNVLTMPHTDKEIGAITILSARSLRNFCTTLPNKLKGANI
jgi:hypothetical protein